MTSHDSRNTPNPQTRSRIHRDNVRACSRISPIEPKAPCVAPSTRRARDRRAMRAKNTYYSSRHTARWIPSRRPPTDVTHDARLSPSSRDRTIARDRDFDRAPNPARDHRATHGRTRRLQKYYTYLDLGRLEGGDAADEGGSEESGHCSRVQEWRGARRRGRSRSRASRVIRGKRRVMTQTSSPPRRSPSRSRPRSRSPVSPRGRSVGHAVGRTRGRAAPTRPDPTSTARARASPFLHTRTMSALLASSFVGRVAAFKATKVQVRTVFFFVDRRWSSSLARRVARDDANGRARAREIRSARAVVVRWTTRDDAIGARAR